MNLRILAGLGVLVAASVTLLAGAGPKPETPEKHRVVFQVTADGEEQWEAVIGNVENLRAAFGRDNTRVQVVAHGKGLGMLVAAGNNATRRERMQKLHDGGVAFAACENTMRKKTVTKDQLLLFAETVDSGVAEVVRKQEQGWAYIKSGL